MKTILRYFITTAVVVCFLAGSSLAQKPAPKTVTPQSGAPAETTRTVSDDAKREALNKRLEERKVELSKEKLSRPKQPAYQSAPSPNPRHNKK